MSSAVGFLDADIEEGTARTTSCGGPAMLQRRWMSIGRFAEREPGEAPESVPRP